MAKKKQSDSSFAQRAGKATGEFFVEQGGKLYRWIRGVDDVNDLRNALEGGAKITRRPPPRSIANAKPFSNLTGSGRTQSSVPSAAQRAERAAQASRMPKPKPATSSGTGGSGRPPARVSGPPQRSGARKDIVVAKPRQVTTPSPRPVRPPAKSTTPAPRPASTARRTLNPAMKAAIASMVAGQSAPTGVPKSKAETMPMPTPKPKAEEFDQKTPRKPAPVTPPKETTNFDAGKNTGFGPKGNIFPGSSEERKALMVMYGGTGSKAGKAAIAGTQGNLAKGQSLLDSAKNKKRSNVGVSSRANPNLKKGGKVTPSKYKGFSKLPEKVQKKMNPKAASKYKKGGKISIKEIKTKGSVSLEQMPSKKYSNPSARQVKGWGAARKPKR